MINHDIKKDLEMNKTEESPEINTIYTANYGKIFQNYSSIIPNQITGTDTVNIQNVSIATGILYVAFFHSRPLASYPLTPNPLNLWQTLICSPFLYLSHFRTLYIFSFRNHTVRSLSGLAFSAQYNSLGGFTQGVASVNGSSLLIAV